MLYIVKSYEEDGAKFEYEYGNMNHALEHYENENTTEIWEYNKGKETLVKRKVNGKEIEWV